MDDRTRDVLARLIGRRNPAPSVLLEVERLGASGVDAICELLRQGALSPRQQDRALHGLAHAAKHAGPREQRLVLELALERTAAQDISLRSRAAHMAVSTVNILVRRRDPTMGDEPHEADVRERVATAVREALRLGLHSSSNKIVQDFLSHAHR